MDKYDTELTKLSPDQRAIWQKAYVEALTETGDDTKAYLAAWGAVNKLAYVTTKSADGKSVVMGWAQLFTDEQRLDLDGEYFDENNDPLLEYYPNAPLWYEHGDKSYISKKGLAPDYSAKPIGMRVKTQVYKRGIWAEHVMHTDHPYYSKAQQEIADGLLSYSVDSIGHYAEKDETGRLLNWVAAGWSLTDRPAEPALGAVMFKSIKNNLHTKASQQRTEHGAGEPAESTGTAASKQNPLISKGAMKMPLSDADITAFQTQLDEGIGSVTMAAVERLREMNAESADEEVAEDEAMASADEVKNDVEELAKSAGKLESVKSAKDVNEALDNALEYITEGVIERHFARKTAKLQFNKKVNNKVSDAMKKYQKEWVKMASEDTTPINDIETKHHNPEARKQATKFGQAPAQVGKAEKPSKLGDAIKHAHYVGRGERSPIKAQSYGSGRLGGFLLDTETNTEIIPALQSKLILRDLGVNFDTISGDSYQQIKQKTNATAYWVGEATTIPETDMEFDVIHAVTKPLAARVPIPYKLIDDTSYNLEQYARRHLEERLARAIEYAALFGRGATTGSNTGAEPLGLLYTNGVTTTPLNRVPTLEDLTGAVLRVQEANVMEDESWQWAFSPRTKNTFANLTDTTGAPLIRRSWIDAPETALVGYDFQTSTAIPNNSVGTSDDQSYIFFGKWSDMHVVVSGNTAEFLVNPYRLQHQLITELVMYMYVDVYIERDESFEILSDIDD